MFFFARRFLGLLVVFVPVALFHAAGPDAGDPAKDLGAEAQELDGGAAA